VLWEVSGLWVCHGTSLCPALSAALCLMLLHSCARGEGQRRNARHCRQPAPFVAAAHRAGTPPRRICPIVDCFLLGAVPGRPLMDGDTDTKTARPANAVLTMPDGTTVRLLLCTAPSCLCGPMAFAFICCQPNAPDHTRLQYQFACVPSCLHHSPLASIPLCLDSCHLFKLCRLSSLCYWTQMATSFWISASYSPGELHCGHCVPCVCIRLPFSTPPEPHWLPFTVRILMCSFGAMASALLLVRSS
jgi:hypothetical protein